MPIESKVMNLDITQGFTLNVKGLSEEADTIIGSCSYIHDCVTLNSIPGFVILFVLYT